MRAKTPIAIKICGITSTTQALQTAALGANAIGVIGVKTSPRFVSEEKRRRIFSELNKFEPKIERVWVIANQSKEEINNGLSGEGRPSIIQLHGQESIERCESLRKKYPEIKWWKAIQVKSVADIVIAKSYENTVDSLLLDAWSKKTLGGTGERLPIELISGEKFKIPWWIAGGISVDWIPTLLSRINPNGIDASSKLESSPGIKDLKKVKELIDYIRGNI